MITLNITVSDLSSILTTFDSIQIQRSDNEAFTENVSIVTTITLIIGTTVYTYNDVTGNTGNWYRSRYYNTSNGVFGSWSSKTRGTEISYFDGATYPVEESFTLEEWESINKVRMYLGDLKKVEREYVDDCYEHVMGDKYTYELTEYGWPLKVILSTTTSSTEFTTLNNPVVQGYRYIVFSGSENIIQQGTTLDLWYTSFKYSDREIKDHYDLSVLPADISSTSIVAEDLLAIEAAINFVVAEIQERSIGGGIRVRDGDTEYDPAPMIRALESKLEFLKNKKKDLIDSATKKCLADIEGVRVE